MRTFRASSLLLGLAMAAMAHAQTMTESYIELTVTDTLPMKLARILYTFTPQATEMNADVSFEDSEQWDKAQRKVEEETKQDAERLKKKLTGEGFKVSDDGGGSDDYTINTFDASTVTNSMTIEVPNEMELKRLVAYLRKEAKGDGFVSKWEQAPGGANETEMMTRLFRKAEDQARTLANLGGRKLGKLIAAHAPGGTTGYTWLDSIMEMARAEMMKSGKFGGPRDLFDLRERSLTFRFGFAE